MWLNILFYEIIIHIIYINLNKNYFFMYSNLKMSNNLAGMCTLFSTLLAHIVK